MNKCRRMLLILGLFCGCEGGAIASTDPSLSLGQANVAAGGSVTLPLTLAGGSSGVASFQVTLTAPTNWTIVSASAVSASLNAGKTVTLNTTNDLLLVYGPNQTPIASGTVATVVIKAPSSAVTGTYYIDLSGTVYSDVNGSPISGPYVTNGAISVLSSTVTAAISISSTSFNVTTMAGVGIPAQVISLTNSGAAGSTLIWSAASDSSWLTVLPAQGTLSANQKSSLTISMSTTSLSAGSYFGALTISDPNALNSPQIVPLSLTVLAPPPGNGGDSNLPDPDLSGIPDSIPLTGTLTLTNASAYNNASFVWSITATPNQNAANLSIISRAASASFKTSSPSASLINESLSPGPYVVSVYAVDNGNASNVSNTVSKSVTLVSANLNNVRVYPDPWRADKHAGKNITFDTLPLGSVITIFSTSGHKIKRLTSSGGIAAWDRTNDSGDDVASGIYLYLITDDQGDKIRGKLAVVK